MIHQLNQACKALPACTARLQNSSADLLARENVVIHDLSLNPMSLNPKFTVPNFLFPDYYFILMYFCLGTVF